MRRVAFSGRRLDKKYRFFFVFALVQLVILLVVVQTMLPEVGERFSSKFSGLETFSVADLRKIHDPVKLASVVGAVRPCPEVYSHAVSELNLDECRTADDSLKVIMIWTTNPETFTIRNQWAIESLLRQHPCASIEVFSNTLPLDTFTTFKDLGFDVIVKRYDLSISGGLVSPGGPGYDWVKNMNQHKDSKFFHVHVSDILRMLLLYKFGGSYFDMDHISLGPTLGKSGPGKNVFGAEICKVDNPDCLEVSDLIRLGVIDFGTVDNVLKPGRSGFQSREGRTKTRITPCNGVLLNWEKEHPLVAAGLRAADINYDPSCWGCLGPRLFGKIMKEKVFSRNGVDLGSTLIIPPGALYPVDYTESAALLQVRNEKVEAFIDQTSPLGIHFFGKVTSDVRVVPGSTMDRILHKALIFGNLPPVGLTRANPRNIFCTRDEDEERKIHDAKIKLLNMGYWKFPMQTIPSDPVQFYEALTKSNFQVLACHAESQGISKLTSEISKSTGMPIMLFTDLSVADEIQMDELHSILLKIGIRSVHAQGFLPRFLEFGSFVKSKQQKTNDIMSGSVFISATYHRAIEKDVTLLDEAKAVEGAMRSSSNREVFLAFSEQDQAEYAERIGVPSCSVWSAITSDRLLLPWASLLTKNGRNDIRRNDLDAVEIKKGRDDTLMPSLIIGLVLAPSALVSNNFSPEVGAACMFENANIYLNGISSHATEPEKVASRHTNFCKGKIVNMRTFTSDLFDDMIGLHDVNIYMPIDPMDVDPNIVLSSLKKGVPIILSDTTSLFDDAPFLKNLLVESRVGNPAAIYHKASYAIQYVRTNQETFDGAVSKFLSDLEEKMRTSWECFTRSSAASVMCYRDGFCSNVIGA